jgi:hypothetical protein
MPSLSGSCPHQFEGEREKVSNNPFRSKSHTQVGTDEFECAMRRSTVISSPGAKKMKLSQTRTASVNFPKDKITIAPGVFFSRGDVACCAAAAAAASRQRAQPSVTRVTTRFPVGPVMCRSVIGVVFVVGGRPGDDDDDDDDGGGGGGPVKVCS